MKIFLSHSEEKVSKAAAADLGALLRSENHTILQLDEAAAWESVPLQGISEEADAVICIVGDATPNQLFELGFLIGSGKPVLLVATEDAQLSPNLDSLQYVRWRDLDKDSSERLVIDWLSEVRTSVAQEGNTSNTGRRLFDAARETPAVLNAISGAQFENLLAELFEKQGYQVERGEKGGGYDLAVHGFRNNPTTLFEVKKLPSNLRVALTSVQQLAHWVDATSAAHGVIVSLSGFSPSAVRLAKSLGPKIELWSLDDVLKEVDKLKQPA